MKFCTEFEHFKSVKDLQKLLTENTESTQMEATTDEAEREDTGYNGQ